MSSPAPAVTRPATDQIVRLIEVEQARFAKTHPRSFELNRLGKEHYLYGGPSHWMRRWAGGFPMYVDRAVGTRITDVDGNTYVDFALGDTGAMCGHANPAITEAVRHQLERGATTMLPGEDSLWIGRELTARFGLPYWGLTTSATDANRACIRLARVVTGRPKVLVFNGCYHGNVEEGHVALRDGRMTLRNDIHPNGIDHPSIAKVIEFNDVAALERALADRDVACVMAEPFMTNYGMIPPVEGYHHALRKATRDTGTLLLIDETHTISSDIGGYTSLHKLDPDMFVLGKAIGGGIPVAVFGLSTSVAEAIWQHTPRVNPMIRQSAHLGFGGTLAGGLLGVAAIRAALEHVLTPGAYDRMRGLALRLANEVAAMIAEYDLPWHVTRVGARVEYMFGRATPRNGTEAGRTRDGLLETLLHVFFLNRGVIITPFHNMVLMCPASTDADVDLHSNAFRALAEFLHAEKVPLHDLSAVSA
jgi:glutamate-1-semialdehyde 2,1-aminomutase